MEMRTDLALELREMTPDCGAGYEEYTKDGARVSRMTVDSEATSRAIGRPRGVYWTVELSALTDSAFLPDQSYALISEPLTEMLPARGTVLVAGLGNGSITPDALGPRAARQITATRHIVAELSRVTGGASFRSAAVIAPGVLGQTGVEAAELLAALCRVVRPAAVIVIDALASRSLSRLGCTVQLSDTGISPGAGVGNNRPSISVAELGVPVIALGVPTVVDALTLAADLTGHADSDAVNPGGRGMIVTPREIDLLIDRAARLLALAVNHALHPAIDPVELLGL